MRNRLNYRELLKNWMQFYSLTADAAKKMFASIWMRMQTPKELSSGKGAEENGKTMERADRTGKT